MLAARRNTAGYPLDGRVSEARSSRLLCSSAEGWLLCGHTIRRPPIQVAGIALAGFAITLCVIPAKTPNSDARDAIPHAAANHSNLTGRRSVHFPPPAPPWRSVAQGRSSVWSASCRHVDLELCAGTAMYRPGPRHQDLLFVRHVYRYRALACPQVEAPFRCPPKLITAGSVTESTLPVTAALIRWS